MSVAVADGHAASASVIDETLHQAGLADASFSLDHERRRPSPAEVADHGSSHGVLGIPPYQPVRRSHRQSLHHANDARQHLILGWLDHRPVTSGRGVRRRSDDEGQVCAGLRSDGLLSAVGAAQAFVVIVGSATAAMLSWCWSDDTAALVIGLAAVTIGFRNRPDRSGR
jgi:hypothetical protein